MDEDWALRMIGDFARQRRYELGLSQMRFAIPSGIKPQTLLFFEKAYNWPARETCWKLELALGWREGSITEFRELARNARNLVIDNNLLHRITAPVPESETDGDGAPIGAVDGSSRLYE